MENEYETEKDLHGRKAGSRMKKGKPEETRGGDRKALAAVVSIAAAVIIFVILTIIQNKIINSVDEMSVVVALADVPEGIVLTEKNMANYFGLESRPSADVPAGYYTSGYALVGKVTGREIKAKEVVTAACVAGEDFYAGLEDPVEISIAADKIGQVVGGSLRAGDIIDIKVIVDTSYYTKGETEEMQDEDTGLPEIGADTGTDAAAGAPGPVGGWQAGEEGTAGADGTSAETELPEGFLKTEDSGFLGDILSEEEKDNMVYSVTGRYVSVTVCEGVKVVNVYNAAGLDTAAAEADGSTQVATVINVAVPRYMEDIIFLAQEEGTLRISRVVDTTAREAESPEADMPSADSGMPEAETGQGNDILPEGSPEEPGTGAGQEAE